MADIALGEALEIREIENWSLAQVEVWGDPIAERILAERLGFELPRVTGETASRGGRLAVRIAPQCLWIIDNDRADGVLFAALPSLEAAVTLLSNSRVRLRLWGRRASEILAANVALDWEGPETTPGRAVQTKLHRVPVLILRETRTSFEIFVPRTFARAIWEWLSDAGPIAVRGDAGSGASGIG